MEITATALPNMSQDDFKKCSRLTFGAVNGYMHETMRLYRDDINSHAILIKEGGKVLAWGLLIPSRSLGEYWGVTAHGMRVTKYTLQIYVRVKERRKGYGTMIMNKAIRDFDPKPFVYPHNEVAGALYSKFTVSAESDYRRRNLKVKK